MYTNRMSEFTEKNKARKEGKANTDPQAYREARELRQGFSGKFGNETKSFWRSAAIGTRGEAIAGGTGKDTEDE